ncbi:hypothetical protein ACFLU6_05135 [Acidobacteriota bacterium]
MSRKINLAAFIKELAEKYPISSRFQDRVRRIVEGLNGETFSEEQMERVMRSLEFYFSLQSEIESNARQCRRIALNLQRSQKHDVSEPLRSQADLFREFKERSKYNDGRLIDEWEKAKKVVEYYNLGSPDEEESIH